MAGRGSYRGGAGRTALVGLLTGLSLISLYLAFLAPTGKLALVAGAGVVPAGAVVSASLAAGFFCQSGSGIPSRATAPQMEPYFFSRPEKFWFIRSPEL